jgi:hypothetical protein
VKFTLKITFTRIDGDGNASDVVDLQSGEGFRRLADKPVAQLPKPTVTSRLFSLLPILKKGN